MSATKFDAQNLVEIEF